MNTTPPSKMTSRQEQASETKKKLMNSALQLFSSQGWAGTHTRDITHAAGVADSLLYHYFPGGKRALLEAILEEISLEGNREIDFAMFGCPHFTLKQAKHIADKIEGKKLKKEMWILTSYHVKELADRMGITEVLEQAGAVIVPDTCPDQPCWSHLKGKVGVTESPKCAYYPKRRGMDFVIRDLDTCIEAALTGEVE